MKRSIRYLWCLSFAVIMGCGSDGSNSEEEPSNASGLEIPASGATSPTSYPNMTLVWQDEFSDNSLNLDNWRHETGTGNNGWGNNELQYYTAENTSIVEGNLVIKAERRQVNNSNFTSSRIITENNFDFKYGRVDIRAALPEGQGMWPALWMLGANFRTVGWPACGEIDIMEMVGGAGKENTVHGTVHWDNAGQYANFGRATTKPSGTFHDDFHVYSITWDERFIRWYVDGNQYNEIDITPADLDEFQKNFFFIINLAVGGNWPGSPNSSTVFPQFFIIDYIRVFQEN